MSDLPNPTTTATGAPESGGAEPPKASAVKRIATGAALVVLPVAGVYLYHKVQQAGDAANAAAEKRFQYNVASGIQQVDPALVKYRLATKFPTGLADARALAIDGQGNLVVAGDQVIRFLGAGGAVARDLKLAEGPQALCIADDGSIYVSLKNRVEVYAADGTKSAAWPSLGKESFITGIAVSGQNVYLADSGKRVVVRTDRAGKVLSEIGKADPRRGLEGLILPSPHLEVAVAGDGSIWLNDTGRHRLENYLPDGTLERFWGSVGNTIEAFPGCCNPTDFILLKDGSFITAEKGIPRIKHYLADGRFDCVIAPPSAFAANMLGLDVAVDASGRVIALERGTGQVHVFEKNPDSGTGAGGKP